MPRILVALDGSRRNEKALETAVKLAQQNGGRLAAVTILDCTAVPPGELLPESCRMQARERLEELLQTAENFAQSRGVLLSAMLREGHAAEGIIACAEEQQADLVVLGSSSKPTRPGELGGTADQVTSHCPCNVLIVK
ncbi:MAG: universal stress protein [Pirellulaceae bacterium]